MESNSNSRFIPFAMLTFVAICTIFVPLSTPFVDTENVYKAADISWVYKF